MEKTAEEPSVSTLAPTLFDLVGEGYELIGMKTPEKPMSFEEYLREYYLKQYVVFLCARYVYRGKLVYVGTDFLIFHEAALVEITGRACDGRPQSEDPIPGVVIVMLQAIESSFRPAWIQAIRLAASDQERSQEGRT